MTLGNERRLPFFDMAFPAGATASFVVSPFAVQMTGNWQTPFLVYAASLFASTMLGAILIVTRHRCHTGSVHAHLMKQTLAKRTIWYDAMARFGSGFAYLGAASWTTSYLVSTLHASIVEAGAVGAWMTAIGVIGYPAGGLMSDKILKRRALTILVGEVGIGVLVLALGLAKSASFSIALAALPLPVLRHLWRPFGQYCIRVWTGH